MQPHTIHLLDYRLGMPLDSTETLDVIDMRDHKDVSFTLDVNLANSLDIEATILASDFESGVFVTTGVTLVITDDGAYRLESQIKARYACLKITRTAGSCVCAVAATAKGA